MYFYKTYSIQDLSGEQFFAIVELPTGEFATVEISKDLKEALDDLQREYWKYEKREQRHTVHIENIPEALLPREALHESPESAYLRKLQTARVIDAFLQIPEKQRRRMIMRYCLDYSVKKIARIECCSDRAIKYSIALAKKNLKNILHTGA